MTGDLFDELDEPHAIARTSDPWTSHQAAASVDRIRASQAEILRVLADGPMTDEEIFEVLRENGILMSLSGARTRRKELVDLNLVLDSGHRKFTKANRRTILWCCNEAGYAIHARTA